MYYLKLTGAAYYRQKISMVVRLHLFCTHTKLSFRWMFILQVAKDGIPQKDWGLRARQGMALPHNGFTAIKNGTATLPSTGPSAKPSTRPTDARVFITRCLAVFEYVVQQHMFPRPVQRPRQHQTQQYHPQPVVCLPRSPHSNSLTYTVSNNNAVGAVGCTRQRDQYYGNEYRDLIPSSLIVCLLIEMA